MTSAKRLLQRLMNRKRGYSNGKRNYRSYRTLMFTGKPGGTQCITGNAQ